MTPKELKAAINRILAQETQYATSLRERGEFGRSKLAVAAVEGVRTALRGTPADDGDGFAGRLLGALDEQRALYVQFWDDEDGIGTSTFARVMDEVEAAL